MQAKIRWGVLGVARIALKSVIPAMQKGERTSIEAVASRDLAKAKRAATDFGIAKAYGSYEELLADPEIDAVYIPLPNHLHVQWSIKAAEAGKHVLCEKPIGLNVAEVRELIAVRDRTGVKIGEAFMVRTHPQWLRTREIVRSGEIGEVRSLVASFSYFNRDPQNIRNAPAYGGGGLMDIGCYPITISRFLFDREPVRVMGLLDYDPEFKVDRLTSAILDFGAWQSIFACSTQLVLYQQMQILGTKGRIQVNIPFNAPIDRSSCIVIDNGSDLFGNGARIEEFPVCDQYTLQGDLFSRAIQEGQEVPVPLEDALGNMAAIEAIFRSGETGKWEQPLIP